jgi:hypothetical protein
VHCYCPAGGAYRHGQELVEDEVLPNEPARQEAGLLGFHQPTLYVLEPVGQDLGQDAVVPVEQRDGAVVVGVGALPGLVQGDDHAIKEPQGHFPHCPDGGVEGGQQGGEDVGALAVKVGGQAIHAGGLARGGVLEGLADLVFCHSGRPQGGGLSNR